MCYITGDPESRMFALLLLPTRDKAVQMDTCCWVFSLLNLPGEAHLHPSGIFSTLNCSRAFSRLMAHSSLDILGLNDQLQTLPGNARLWKQSS